MVSLKFSMVGIWLAAIPKNWSKMFAVHAFKGLSKSNTILNYNIISFQP